jgi:hypothetical protein
MIDRYITKTSMAVQGVIATPATTLLLEILFERCWCWGWSSCLATLEMLRIGWEFVALGRGTCPDLFKCAFFIYLWAIELVLLS